MLVRAVDNFFTKDAAGGILLMLSAAAALAVYNSSLAPAYDAFLNATFSVKLNGAGLEKPLILWINDGLMAVFFFLIALELKRELREGKLREPSAVVLPGLAAIGGMAVPAAIYAALNWGSPTIEGWAIPAATDIAFALGILALLGKRCHPSLKAFLLTLAILDDLGAIVIIALFYTENLNLTMLGAGMVPLALLAWMNWRGLHRIAPYVLVGGSLWFLVLESGVHATLAGVAVAFLIPLKDRRGGSPLHALEGALAPYVLYLIVPLFAFANAGVSLSGLGFADLMAPTALGIAAGLFIGKQIGVFGFAWAAVRFGFARLPEGMGWLQVWGLACLAGIGFTMSLFIGGLSFDDPALAADVRLGVLSGSLCAAVLGFMILRAASKPQPESQRTSASAAANTAG